MADLSILQELFVRTLGGGPKRRIREFGESFGNYEGYLEGFNQDKSKDLVPGKLLMNTLSTLTRLFSGEDEEDDDLAEEVRSGALKNVSYANPQTLNYTSEAKRFYDNSNAKRFYDNSNAKRFLG